MAISGTVGDLLLQGIFGVLENQNNFVERGAEWILGFCSEMQEVQDMLIFVGESKRMWIECILIGLLSRERVLFEEV